MQRIPGLNIHITKSERHNRLTELYRHVPEHEYADAGLFPTVKPIYTAKTMVDTCTKCGLTPLVLHKHDAHRNYTCIRCGEDFNTPLPRSMEVTDKMKEKNRHYGHHESSLRMEKL